MDDVTPLREAMMAGEIDIVAADGAPIRAYAAMPTGDDGPYGTVIVLHHMHGLDDGTKEIVRRFAHHRFTAVCPDLYSRERAGGSSLAKAAATVRAAGGVPDDQLVEDVRSVIAYASKLPSSNGKVGVIGYCSGGRQAFLAACHLPLDAAVDCYGPFIVSAAPSGFPLTARPLAHLAPQLGCPLLGLFGADDEFPRPEETRELAGILGAAGKDFEHHTFDGAGHAFFDASGPRFRPNAANEGWARTIEFFESHLTLSP